MASPYFRVDRFGAGLVFAGVAVGSGCPTLDKCRRASHINLVAHRGSSKQPHFPNPTHRKRLQIRTQSRVFQRPLSCVLETIFDGVSSICPSVFSPAKPAPVVRHCVFVFRLCSKRVPMCSKCQVIPMDSHLMFWTHVPKLTLEKLKRGSGFLRRCLSDRPSP